MNAFRTTTVLAVMASTAFFAGCGDNAGGGLFGGKSRPTASVSDIMRHLDSADKSVYFEVAKVDLAADEAKMADIQRFVDRVADGLVQVDAIETDEAAMLRRAPAALRELGVFSFCGFGRSVVDEGKGIRLHRSFWAGGGSRIWDLVATDEAAPVECLPANAALAVATSADPRAVLDVARSVSGAVDPEALAMLDAGSGFLREEAGIDPERLLGTLRPGSFAALTLDPDKAFELEGISLPAPGLVFGVRCDSRDLYATVLKFVEEAGIPFRPSEKSRDGEEGFSVSLPDLDPDDLPFEVSPSVRWSPKKKILVFASTEELARNAFLKKAPKLVDSPAFKKCASGLPKKGSVRWLSPELFKLAARLASEIPDLPDFAKSLVGEVGEFWYVGRSRRFANGLESVSRSPLPSPAFSRFVTELLEGGGMLAGFFAGFSTSAFENVQLGANKTIIGNSGRNVVQAILQANNDRMAAALSELWPKKNKFVSSDQFFGRLLDKQLIEDVSLDDVKPFDGGTVAWCCLAGISGEGSMMPFLWSPNLELTEADFARPVDPNHPVDWSGKLKDHPAPGRNAVILVRKGGALAIIPRDLLTDVAFFGGERAANPYQLEILRPAEPWSDEL